LRLIEYRKLCEQKQNMTQRNRQPIRLISLGLAEWWQTQAAYHAVAECMTEDTPDTIILCRPRTPYVCLGYHQALDEVFDARQLQRLGLPVLRRRLGGGATYLDRNQLFYQCIFHKRRVPVQFDAVFRKLLQPPVHALRALGLPATLRKINEIEVGGKRIAGTGGGQIGEACVVVGNVLFDFDYDAMVAAWRAPSADFRELAAAALREQLVTLARLDAGITFAQAEPALVQAYAEALGAPLQPGVLSPREAERARLLGKQLAAPEFVRDGNSGRPAMRSLKIAAEVFIHAADFGMNGDTVRGAFWVVQGIIRQARLRDPNGAELVDVAERLRGQPFAAVTQENEEMISSAATPQPVVD